MGIAAQERIQNGFGCCDNPRWRWRLGGCDFRDFGLSLEGGVKVGRVGQCRTCRTCRTKCADWQMCVTGAWAVPGLRDKNNRASIESFSIWLVPSERGRVSDDEIFLLANGDCRDGNR